jgi:IS30 family transposase
MEKNYKQLSLEERCTITRLQTEGKSIRQIAAIMDRSASTISRELIRNHGADYKPSYADERE